MKKIFFAILASFAFYGTIQAQSNYKVLNIYKNGEILEKYKLADFDSLTVMTVERHEYIDLGLPSGTLWATTNIGAVSPADYGDYFSWGETQPKEEYNYSTYKWCDGTYNSMTKYCTKLNYGVVDNKTQLEPADDAATANWGSDWFMPTKEQIDELLNSDYTTWIWTTQTNSKGESINGRQIVSKINGKSIFLPAAGGARDKVIDNFGAGGSYMSSTIDPTDPTQIFYISFKNNYYQVSRYYRSYGHSVRPVRIIPEE